MASQFNTQLNRELNRESLADWIKAQITREGPVTVAQFMEWALYHPQFGYYTQGPNIGPRGDFTTSPEASPAFGRLLANHVADVDALLGHPQRFSLVECGPGRGTLAGDLLDTLRSERPDLYARLYYSLVEISPTLRQAQQGRLVPQHGGKVAWAETIGALPADARGAVIGNEFVDAFPVHVLENRGGAILEQYVDVGAEKGFKITHGEPSDPKLIQFTHRYEVRLEPGESMEINLAAARWLHEAARMLERGVVALIDYGDVQPARYSAARRQGTLLGYYGGSVTHRILEHPGEQDLTALVDFTALQDEAVAAGFSLVGLTRQASFLVGLGLGTTLTLDGGGPDVPTLLDYRRGLQALISMEGLGKFHVLLLSKKLPSEQAQRGLSGLKYAGVF